MTRDVIMMVLMMIMIVIIIIIIIIIIMWVLNTEYKSMWIEFEWFRRVPVVVF